MRHSPILFIICLLVLASTSSFRLNVVQSSQPISPNRIQSTSTSTSSTFYELDGKAPLIAKPTEHDTTLRDGEQSSGCSQISPSRIKPASTSTSRYSALRTHLVEEFWV